MANDKTEKPGAARNPLPPEASKERRRTGRVVHDDRGNARLEWLDVAADADRVPLSVDDSHKGEPGYDPYHKTPRTLHRKGSSDLPRKRDLRRLSDWIKQMRALEARKRLGDDSDEEA